MKTKISSLFYHILDIHDKFSKMLLNHDTYKANRTPFKLFDKLLLDQNDHDHHVTVSLQ